MDLKPMRPHKNRPKDKYGKYVWGRYNLCGWVSLINLLHSWDIDTSEFSGFNDGDLICAATCKIVAQTIKDHLDELSEQDRKWLEPHIELWQTSGGYRQY